jgi:hypothetical protein
MSCRKRLLTGEMESVTSATITAGCSGIVLQAAMAITGAATFRASRERTRGRGLPRR